eukprot:scaffold480_cov257-Pinguiococcus_pyrenoidosus.AAC.19
MPATQQTQVPGMIDLNVLGMQQEKDSGPVQSGRTFPVYRREEAFLQALTRPVGKPFPDGKVHRFVEPCLHMLHPELRPGQSAQLISSFRGLHGVDLVAPGEVSLEVSQVPGLKVEVQSMAIAAVMQHKPRILCHRVVRLLWTELHVEQLADNVGLLHAPPHVG